MKKYLILLSGILIASSISAQDSVKTDTAWKFGGIFSLTLSQAGFTNWSAGGENSYSGNGRLGLSAIYVKEKIAWENNLDMAYGKANQSGVGLRKTDDQIELNSKFGVRASKKWYYTAVFNAQTQLDKGFQYSDVDSIPDIVTSESFAPLYVNFALGADYKANKYTSVFISPINVKNVYVYDSKYAPKYSIDSAKNSKTDIGALVKFKYEKEVIKNLNFLTKLNIFANYLELNSVSDIDVNWEVLVTMNVFKMFSINLNTHLIWDNDVKYANSDGTFGDARAQFKEIFGAGLAYKF
jgi:hypothetical protein